MLLMVLLGYTLAHARTHRRIISFDFIPLVYASNAVADDDHTRFDIKKETNAQHIDISGHVD